ncbi:hypothetical protein K438DRAFT_1998695 [Mycena galopus ATCC 62051]|nr:hypothetical protein K438DRAFT_1998695 [Mycena galopus ATCC 62051]
MPNARHHGIADAHRFEAPTFMDWLEGESPDACAPIGPHRSVTSTSCSGIPGAQANDLIASIVRLGSPPLKVQSVKQRHPESNGRERADRNTIRPPRPVAACADSTLCEKDVVGFSSAPFPHPSFLLALPTILFRPRGVYADVVLSHPVPPVSPPPVRPSLLPTPLERRVRDAPRLRTLPAARAGALQLNDAAWMRSMTTNFEAIPRVLDAPHPTPRTHVTLSPTPMLSAHQRMPDTTRGRCSPSSTHAALMDPMGPTTFFNRVTLSVLPPAASIPYPMRHFPRLFLGADPTFVLPDVINVKASAGPVSILAAAVKNLKNADDGGRSRKRKSEGGEEDEGAGGEIPRWFFLPDSSSMPSMGLLNEAVAGDNPPAYGGCWIGRRTSYFSAEPLPSSSPRTIASLLTPTRPGTSDYSTTSKIPLLLTRRK